MIYQAITIVTFIVSVIFIPFVPSVQNGDPNNPVATATSPIFEPTDVTPTSTPTPNTTPTITPTPNIVAPTATNTPRPQCAYEVIEIVAAPGIIQVIYIDNDCHSYGFTAEVGEDREVIWEIEGNICIDGVTKVVIENYSVMITIQTTGNVQNLCMSSVHTHLADSVKYLYQKPRG